MAHPFRTKAIIAFLYLAPSILALPEVKIIPLPSACSSYPGYNSTTDIAGPWSALADSTNSSIDNLPASAASFTNDGVDRFGFVCLPSPAVGPAQNSSPTDHSHSSVKSHHTYPRYTKV